MTRGGVVPGSPRRLGRGDRLVLATHNAGKLREIAALVFTLGGVAVALRA